MKRHSLYLAVLIALSGASLSASTTAQPTEDRTPSWIERIFGSKEATKEVIKEEPQPAERAATESSKKAAPSQHA
jgi:hypothetical protein